MSDARLIGEIELLQSHGDLLVPGDSFDPKPLIEVDAPGIDQAGVVGWTGDSWALDVHHRSWPGRGGRRPVSIGFTSHYDKIRRRFRDIPLGARPCRQFTSFLLELPYKAEREDTAEELEFLDGGTRGFIFCVDGLEAPMRVERSDHLLVI